MVLKDRVFNSYDIGVILKEATESHKSKSLRRPVSYQKDNYMDENIINRTYTGNYYLVSQVLPTNDITFSLIRRDNKNGNTRLIAKLRVDSTESRHIKAFDAKVDNMAEAKAVYSWCNGIKMAYFGTGKVDMEIKNGNIDVKFTPNQLVK